ncbi:MAG: hypothetical protein PVS3B1_07100 [Ktedonobacteraceae bacterium]
MKSISFFDDFDQAITAHWTQTCMGLSSLSVANSVLQMGLSPMQQGQYADAQIDDYGQRARADFPWRPPLRMEVRARSSLPAATPTETTENTHVLRGTAGFGFWNYPFSIRGDLLMLPEAVWFFYASPPSNMALVPGVAGYGWKAQVIHALRPETLLAAVPTALATVWGHVSNDTRPAARWMQRLSGAQETLLSVEMTEWHTYILEWRAGAARFWVDGTQVLYAPHPPDRALGFVAWLDNQYAIATPRGILRFGAVACGAQQFEIDSIRIDPL